MLRLQYGIGAAEAEWGLEVWERDMLLIWAQEGQSIAQDALDDGSEVTTRAPSSPDPFASIPSELKALS